MDLNTLWASWILWETNDIKLTNGMKVMKWICVTPATRFWYIYIPTMPDNWCYMMEQTYGEWMNTTLLEVQLCVYFNSLAPGRPGCHFKTAIFNLILLIGFFRSFHNNAPRWMLWDLTDGKSTLVQLMAWCRQATSHYLSQCWPSSMLPYGVTRPQWVKEMAVMIFLLRFTYLPHMHCTNLSVSCNIM